VAGPASITRHGWWFCSLSTRGYAARQWPRPSAHATTRPGRGTMTGYHEQDRVAGLGGRAQRPREGSPRTSPCLHCTAGVIFRGRNSDKDRPSDISRQAPNRLYLKFMGGHCRASSHLPAGQPLITCGFFLPPGTFPPYYVQCIPHTVGSAVPFLHHVGLDAALLLPPPCGMTHLDGHSMPAFPTSLLAFCA